MGSLLDPLGFIPTSIIFLTFMMLVMGKRSPLLIILTLGIELGSLLYFDIALLIALFGFVGSAALAKFLLRGELIEP